MRVPLLQDVLEYTPAFVGTRDRLDREVQGAIADCEDCRSVCLCQKKYEAAANPIIVLRPSARSAGRYEP
jgi:hypothetical protein